MSKIRTAVAGLLIAGLFPLLLAPTSGVEAQVLPLPLPSISVPTAVPLPPLPRPLPSQINIPRPPPIVVVSPTPVPVPVPVPGPTRTVIRDNPDGTRTITIIKTVPGPVRTVLVPTPTPVPGPTKTVISEKFTPGQERVIEKIIRAERIKFGLAGVVAGFLVTFAAVCLVAYRFFRKGEIHGLRLLRDSI